MTPSYVSELRTLVDDAAERLLNLPPEIVVGKPQPEKWSPKEIVGHLIDSVANNDQRFVRLQQIPGILQ